jgi:hypothetical protein
MPVFFGPSTGPRQDQHGKPYDWSGATRSVATVSFLTDAKQLEAIFPPGFRLDGEPVVTIEHFQLFNLPWLAGRGYNAFGMRFPVRFDGRRDHVRGPLLTVLWEDLTDAILTGREELGYSKLYADLPPPAIDGNRATYVASWGGHEFAKMTIYDLEQAEPAAPPNIDGLLHYRYYPAVNNPKANDVATVTMTPASGPTRTEKFSRGAGSVEFLASTWEQLPTQFQIVNTLAALPVLEARGATLASQRGAKDLSDVRVLE